MYQRRTSFGRRPVQGQFPGSQVRLRQFLFPILFFLGQHCMNRSTPYSVVVDFRRDTRCDHCADTVRGRTAGTEHWLGVQEGTHTRALLSVRDHWDPPNDPQPPYCASCERMRVLEFFYRRSVCYGWGYARIHLRRLCDCE